MAGKGCAVQMDTFADMLRSTAKEHGKNVYFRTSVLEKNAGISFKKREGFVYCTAVFSVNREGKYEVHLTAKSGEKYLRYDSKRL